MSHKFNRIPFIFIACALLAFAPGCAEDNKSNSKSGGQTGGGGENPGGGEGGFPLVYGGQISLDDLPIALADDPPIPAPAASPGEDTMPLSLVTDPWAAKAPGDISDLLQFEFDSDPSDDHRDAIAALGLEPAPENPEAP
jgi:hypothetical protein